MGLYQSVSFTVQAQEQSNPKLTINSSESTIQKVLLKIEKASGYNFRYSEEISKDTRLFSFHFEEEEFLEILHTIANDTGLEFKRNGKNISVKFQERKSVKGKVTDVQTGESLIGVTVSIKGTTQGSVTDFEGNYSIMAKPSDQLQFSFVGYANQYFRVGNNSKIDVVLESETKGLDEIIVIGYGAQSKAKVTGAISKVKTVELNKYPSRSFDQQLSGKVAGVQVNEFSGQPGANAQIVIRGTGTITAGSSPLVVVDGVPLTEGSGLGFINTNDIESVDILKDAASASIYGSRGANGVILITTKKGKVGAPKFNLDMYFGWQKRSDNVEYADAYDAAQYFTEARDWGYVSKDPVNRNIEDDRATRISKGANKRELRLNYLAPYLNGEKGLTNTNWLDELYRTAPVQNYSLSVSGGTEKTDYFVSGNYLQQDGTLIETDYSRISSSIKINSQLSKRVKLSFSLNPSYSKQNFFNSGSWNDDPAAMAIIAYPFFTPYNDDGSLNISAQLNANAAEDGALGENPVAIARMLRNNKTTFRTYGNAQLSFELIQGLQFKTMFGGDFRNDFADYFNPSAVGKYRGPAPKTASAQERNTRVENIISENTINYKLKSKKHELDLIAGMTYQKENSTYTKVKGTDIADDNITNIQGAGSHTVQASRYRWTQLSYLARAQYFYQNRYQISAAFRRDGSSRFGDKSKWANFPSLALGWIISEESFSKIANAYYDEVKS